LKNRKKIATKLTIASSKLKVKEMKSAERKIPRMLVYLFKRKRFVISFLFLSTLIIASILNTVLNDGNIRQTQFRADANGNLIDRAPYPPFTLYILGSDAYGYDLGHVLIEGAKWTIGIVLVVALLRIILSLIVSSFVFSLKPGLFNVIKSIFEPFSVVPQTIIAFFILFSVLWRPGDGFHTSFWERAGFETIVLVLLAVPNLTIHLANEMRIVEKDAFIEAAKTLGAGKMRIFFKHIVPHVYEKWILLFGQQFIQSLTLLAHLGFMGLFFGGTIPPSDDGTPPRSVSFEWSGVIGGDISYLYSYSWIVLVPIGFFVATAISVALINDSFKSYFHSEERQQVRTKKAAKHEEPIKIKIPAS
jgi:peptide/nickel transport system permease protein